MTEENKYLDTLFQSKFSAFEAEPPAQVWNNIHANLHNKRGGSINPVNLATIAALVLISGLLSFSLIKDSQYFAPGEDAATSPASTPESNEVLAQYLPPETPSPSNNIVPEATTSSDSENTSSLPVPDNNFSTELQHGKNAAAHAFASETNSDHQAAISKAGKRGSSWLRSGNTFNDGSISVRDSKVQPKFFGQGDPGRRYNRQDNWQLGVLFTPAISFYPDDSILNQRSYTFEAAVKWTRREFFIESGLGLSFSSDDGRNNIDYEKYLGAYDDVYNVTFDTAANGTLIPTYYTNVVNVYDSISRYKVEQTKNNYTYLQVPLYIGFQKQVNRFGWFVKGGPVFSLLIKENISQPEAGNDRIIGLDRQMAGRVGSYWQFAVSAGLNYQLSNRVSIAIEPTFRYYLNSQYERTYISTRHPYSIGLRTGLLFNF